MQKKKKATGKRSELWWWWWEEWVSETSQHDSATKRINGDRAIESIGPSGRCSAVVWCSLSAVSLSSTGCLFLFLSLIRSLRLLHRCPASTVTETMYDPKREGE